MINLRDFALKTGEAYENLQSFECDQEITAGNLRIQAHLRFKKPRKLTVEYDEFSNPLEEFETKLFGGPEFNGDDLENTKITYDGKSTWLHMLNKDTAIKKEGKNIYSPFGGVDVIGQLKFLTTLVKDFLLKDNGEGKISGRKVQRLGLKPKVTQRSLFLKDEVFSLDKAELAIDTETNLPLKITYHPGQRDQLRFPSSQGGPIFVEYSDYQVDKLSEKNFEFDSSKIDLLFEQKDFTEDQFSEEFPIPLDLEKIEEEGFEPMGDRLSMMINQKKDRAYASIGFLSSSKEEEKSSLQLLAGNYLSREMNRHRAYLSENGEETEVNDKKIKVADRGKSVQDRLSDNLDRSILEVGGQIEESFYYLLGQGVNRERLLDIFAAIGP